MNEVEQRTARAVERILEDESLTANLQDAAAKVLIAWSIDCIRDISHRIDGLDESSGMEIMSDKLQAVRGLMRRVDRWVAKRPKMDKEAHAQALAQVLEQASLVYGDRFIPPTSYQQDQFRRAQLVETPSPVEFIKRLRALIEPSTSGPPDDASAVQTTPQDAVQGKHPLDRWEKGLWSGQAPGPNPNKKAG